VSLKEQKLPPLATLRAIAALKSPHLAQVRPARIGLGFETVAAPQKSLAHLEDLLEGPGRLALPYSLRLLLDAMAGLGTLHRALGFVHGEVQPEHVLLGEDGVGRLLPVVRAHWVRGEERPARRLYYLAPEKLLGDTVDARSDVFSVGVLLWEAVSGQRLLEAYDVDDIIARLMGGGIPRAHAPEEESWTEPLSSIAECALAVDPSRRFATLGQMREAIEQASSRYLASTPGMVELFQAPARGARGASRDSTAPDSQRITLPPHQAPPTIKPRPLSQPPPAAAVRPVGVGVADYIEEELTTKPNAAPLLNARLRPSVPVLITPVPKPPAAPVTLATARIPSRSTTPVSFPAPPANPPPRLHVDSHSQAASLSPLVAARPAVAPLPTAEPSFELLRPRRRRGALWLLLGAAAAVALFAARPWLTEQLTAPGGAAHSVAAHGESTSLGPTMPPPSSLESAAPGARPSPSAGGSKPASPAAGRTPARPRGPREEHVVIEDTIDPSIQALREPVKATAEPPPPPNAPSAEPPPPPEPAKAKPAPASDADRYGI
jgi:eukaryotic-like serine/threonine-protein kinase